VTGRRRGSEARRLDSIGSTAWGAARDFSVAIQRCMAILECFATDRRARGVSEVSGLLGMNRNTTKRYVAMLYGLGHLDRAPRQKYRLGLGTSALGLSTISELGLHELAESALSTLNRETGCPASLVTLDADEIVVVSVIGGDRKDSSIAVPATRRKGRRLPAYCTAGGKILLAGLPTYEIEALLEDVTSRQLAPTIALRDLRETLDMAKSEGVAVEESECPDHVWALAAPVWNHLQEIVAAVVLQVPDGGGSREFRDHEVVSSLRAAGRAISAWLGYRDVVEVCVR
jgi:DNA-binding IclR family transcriptional regulator